MHRTVRVASVHFLLMAVAPVKMATCASPFPEDNVGGGSNSSSVSSGGGTDGGGGSGGKAPDCKDGIKNGDETDVDCGGLTCPKCADGKGCKVPSDCAVLGCAGGVCSQCGDSMKNGQESDIDCGGVCPKCAEQKKCGVPSDCMYGICDATNTCNTCNDKTKNGTETDVDCGGICATLNPPLKCAATKGCMKPADCLSDVCTAGICQAATCMDGAQNGPETDIDCGGVTCNPCPSGKKCLLNTDCVTNQCLANKTCM